jgi:hypothetical protein
MESVSQSERRPLRFAALRLTPAKFDAREARAAHTRNHGSGAQITALLAISHSEIASLHRAAHKAHTQQAHEHIHREHRSLLHRRLDVVFRKAASAESTDDERGAAELGQGRNVYAKYVLINALSVRCSKRSKNA